MLLDSPNVHPPLKNNQRNKANLNCKCGISLLIEHALIIWDKIKTLQVRLASKESTRCVKSTRNNAKKQTRKINKFELLFVLFYDDWFFDSCPVEVNR